MERYHLKELSEENWDSRESGDGWRVSAVHSYGDSKYLGHQMVMRCPKCKGLTALLLHSIDTNGEVNASVLCNQKRKVEDTECGWHEWVVLDGWDPAWRKVANEEYLTKV